MSARPWYKRYGADFITSTMMLSLEEKGAYSLCLDLIYDRGGPIPDDARYLSGVCGVSIRKWKALRQQLIDEGKLAARDGALSNSRASFELENVAKTRRKRAESGAKGGRKVSENDAVHHKNNDLTQANPSRAHARVQSLDKKERKREVNSSSIESVAATQPAAAADPDLLDIPDFLKRATSAERAVAVGRRVADIMGVAGDPGWFGDWGIAASWLAEGADWELDIEPTVKRLMARRNGHDPPRSLAYFTDAIAEARDRRMKPQSTRKTDERTHSPANAGANLYDGFAEAARVLADEPTQPAEPGEAEGGGAGGGGRLEGPPETG
jgi:uncharacterized protein YdaU (DUF1376 family)